MSRNTANVGHEGRGRESLERSRQQKSKAQLEVQKGGERSRGDSIAEADAFFFKYILLLLLCFAVTHS
jgi:hypothetical protein